MRWSRTFIPTLRDNPSEAEFPSHQLLIRGGFARQLAAGIYSYLPLGQRTLIKIISIIRAELDSVGAQEHLLPALHPGELMQETRRWNDPGESSFRLKDRAGRDLYLGMTSEEVFADIARKELRSYRDLPQIWYQIQSKFRDEARPRYGLFGLRQFIMTDACSFDLDAEDLDRSYQQHRDTWCRIFSRCGLKFAIVEGSSGATGDSQLLEFMIRTEAGDDLVAACDCGYAANLGRAVSQLPRAADCPADQPLHEVHTPGKRTIAEIADFLKVAPSHQIKSLVYIINQQPHLFLLRGDHYLSEAKLSAAVGAVQARPAQPEEILAAFGADAGSLGPLGVTGMPIYADLELRDRHNLTCGANKNDYHLQGVTPGVHFDPIWVDLRIVEKGEACIQCGHALDVYRAAEAGRILKLGTKYSQSMGVMILKRDGEQTPAAVGSYRIGVDRILASVIELHHDADGILWPVSIAPFTVIVTPVNYRNEVKAAADRLYDELSSAGVDTLLDDRLERPGVKFKDADLIGIPFRVVVGDAGLRQGRTELFTRASKTTRLVNLADVVPTVKSLLAAAG